MKQINEIKKILEKDARLIKACKNEKLKQMLAQAEQALGVLERFALVRSQYSKSIK